MNNLDFNLIANMLEAGGDERGVYTSAAVAEQVRLLREADNRDGAGVRTARLPAGTKPFEIWSEGFAATGDRGYAHHHATIAANSFKEACDKYAAQNPEFRKYYNPDRLTHWGCRLFDNERQARVNFG